MIRLHEEVASLVAPSRSSASRSTRRPAESEARAEIARVAAETGLPTRRSVPLRAERLMDGIREQLETPAVGLSCAAGIATRSSSFRSATLPDRPRGGRPRGDDGDRLADATPTGRAASARHSRSPTTAKRAAPSRRSCPLLLEAAQAALGTRRDRLDRAQAWLVDAATAMDARIGHNGAAKAGLDIALHDRVATAAGHPALAAARHVRGHPADRLLDRHRHARRRSPSAPRRAAHFPALKIKVGGPADLETLEAVRAVYAGPIRVDANTGWQPEDGARLIPELVRLGVELIEQPFPAHQLPSCAGSRSTRTLPIVADESAVTIDDLEHLVGVVAGINVKLTKCGGVGPAQADARRARELGFKVMLGCMEETSVGIAAAGARSRPGRLDRPRRQPAARRTSRSRARARRRLPLAARTTPGLGVRRAGRRRPDDHSGGLPLAANGRGHAGRAGWAPRPCGQGRGQVRGWPPFRRRTGDIMLPSSRAREASRGGRGRMTDTVAAPTRGGVHRFQGHRRPGIAMPSDRMRERVSTERTGRRTAMPNAAPTRGGPARPSRGAPGGRRLHPVLLPAPPDRLAGAVRRDVRRRRPGRVPGHGLRPAGGPRRGFSLGDMPGWRALAQRVVSRRAVARRVAITVGGPRDRRRRAAATSVMRDGPASPRCSLAGSRPRMLRRARPKPGCCAGRSQARMLRRASSVSIWRSAST